MMKYAQSCMPFAAAIQNLQKSPYCFGWVQDWFSSVSKLRRAGFNGMKVDTAEMFIRQFEQLSRDKVIP